MPLLVFSFHSSQTCTPLNASLCRRSCLFVLSSQVNCRYVCVGPKVNNFCLKLVCVCLLCECVSQASCLVGVTVSRYSATSPWHKLSLTLRLRDADTHTHAHNTTLTHSVALSCMVSFSLQKKLHEVKDRFWNRPAAGSACWASNRAEMTCLHDEHQYQVSEHF